MMESCAVNNMINQGKIFEYLRSTRNVGFHLNIFFVGKPADLI